MKRILITALFLSMIIPAGISHAEDHSFTLDEALARAMEANRDVAASRERLSEIEGLKGEALSTWLPQVTGVMSYTRTWKKPNIFINDQMFKVGTYNTYLADVQMSQMLWDGGKVLKALDAAESEGQRGRADIRNTQAEIALGVKQTFYQILYTGKVIEVLRRQRGQLKGHLASIKTRFEKGLDSDYAVMRQEVELSNIEPQLIDAEKSHELFINVLKILLAVPIEDNIALRGELAYRQKAMPELGRLLEKAKSDRPDLLAEKHRERSLMLGIGVEKAGYWPVLSLSALYDWQGQTDDWRIESNEQPSSLSTTVGFSWPIFDGLKTHSRVKQAKAKFLQQKYSTSQMEDNVSREVKDAAMSLKKAEATLASQQGSYDTARRATAIAGERFRAGLMSQLELNDTITAQAQAEQLYFNAIYNCLYSVAVLERTIGGATDEQDSDKK